MPKTGQEQAVDGKVTRRDIAQMAGVSVSVVSRALNNSGYVKKESKEKILQIAQELHYTPNPVAMSLQQRRTHQLLYYCTDIHNAFNMDIYSGMMQEARKRNYMILINGDMNFNQIRETMADGVILQNESHAEEYDRVCGKNYYLPAVSAGYGKRPLMSHPIPFVEWDLYQAMDLAVEYLREKGHEKIAYLTIHPYGGSHMRTISWIGHMRPVLKEMLPRYYIGIHPDDLGMNPELEDYRELLPVSELKVKERFFEKGRVAARIFYQRQMDATALIGYNEEFTYGIMYEFQQLGVRVPADISIISFDGSHRREQVWPKMVCVDGHPVLQGKLLAETLINMIEGKNYHYISRIPTNVLEGGTVLDICGERQKTGTDGMSR